MHNAGTRTMATNALFGVFFLAIFGWVLLQVSAVQAGAGGLIHILIAVPGFTLCAMVLYRYSRHWPARETVRSSREEAPRPSLDFRSAIWYSLLALIGTGMATLACGGAVFPLTCATAAMVIVPWTRIPVCRDHFFISSAILGIGASVGMILSGKSLHPFHHVLSALTPLVTAVLMMSFVVMTHRNRFDRMPASGY